MQLVDPTYGEQMVTKSKLGCILILILCLAVGGLPIAYAGVWVYCLLRGPGYWVASHEGASFASYDGGATFIRFTAGPDTPHVEAKYPEIYLVLPGERRLLLQDLRESCFSEDPACEVERGQDIFGKDYTEYMYGGLNGDEFKFQEGKLTGVIIRGSTRIGFCHEKNGKSVRLPMAKRDVVRLLGRPKMDFVSVPWGA